MGRVKRIWQDTGADLSYFGGRDIEEKQTLRLSGRIPDLSFLAGQVAMGEGVNGDVLRSGNRKRSIGKARKLFCQIAVRRPGYSGAEVVRFLGGDHFICKQVGYRENRGCLYVIYLESGIIKGRY